MFSATMSSVSKVVKIRGFGGSEVDDQTDFSTRSVRKWFCAISFEEAKVLFAIAGDLKIMVYR